MSQPRRQTLFTSMEISLVKHGNTKGPIIPEDRYYIPVAQHIDLDEIKTPIERKKYFVLHAPRQSGKTTTLLEIMRLLKARGKYKCLYRKVGQYSNHTVGRVSV